MDYKCIYSQQRCIAGTK